jgi:tripartite ATP-independent transporter DctP family solute receptor
MRRWSVGAAALAVGLAAAGWAEAGTYKPEYTNSLVVGPVGPWGEAAARFADLVKERSGGRIHIKNYFAGQLFAGKQTNEFLLLRQGVADFAFASTINWSPQLKELNLFALPFFVGDYKGVDAIKQGEAGRRLFHLVEEKGGVPLCWGENGFRELTNSKRAVRAPEDLAGLKIRVVGSPIFVDTFKALGANPVSMNWAEAQTAFQQGTVDGQENPVVSIVIPFKLWQSQKHITLWKYAIDPLIVAASKQTWETFDGKDQEVIRRAAQEACDWQVKAARAGLADGTEAVDTLKKNGMEVTIPSAADLAAFKARTRAVHDKWVTEVGADLVRLAEQDKARAK